MSCLITGLLSPLLASLLQGGGWMELPSLPLADRLPTLESIPDLDGDGKRDVAVGFSSWGRVDLVSSVTGLTLGSIPAPLPGSAFGRSLASVGDLDGDGRGDLAVAADSEYSGGLSSNGAIYFLSLPTGIPLAVARGVLDYERLGSEIHTAGDLDGDGVPDLLTRSHQPGESVVALSGATGARIYQVWPLSPSSSQYWNLAVVGDLDGDHASEFAVGVPGLSGPQHASNGWIGIYSGRNGMLLREIWGWSDHLYLGTRIASAGDVDRDGFADLLVTHAQYTGSDPFAVVFSGRTGAVCRELLPDSRTAGLSFSVHQMRACPDLDGDGRNDLLLWNPNARKPPEFYNGVILIYDSWSGRLNGLIVGQFGESLGFSLATAEDLGFGSEPDLLVTRFEGLPMVIGRYGFSDLITASTDSVSASGGGTIRLQMEFPPEEADRPYLVLVSASGSGPTNFGGVAVPLTRDAIYDRMILGPPSEFVGARGRLDASATAQAQLRFAPGWAAAVIGRSLRFAAVSYEGVLAGLSSRAVVVQVEP